MSAGGLFLLNFVGTSLVAACALASTGSARTGGVWGLRPPPVDTGAPPGEGHRARAAPPRWWRPPQGGKRRSRSGGIHNLQESAVKPIFLISGPQVSYSAFCQRACSSGVEPWGIRPTMARLSMTDFSFSAALMAALAAAITGLGVAAGA